MNVKGERGIELCFSISFFFFFCLFSDNMTGMSESVCKSISRILEFTARDDFATATLEQVKVRLDKLGVYYERFVQTHERYMERDPDQAVTYDGIAGLLEERYYNAKEKVYG